MCVRTCVVRADTSESLTQRTSFRHFKSRKRMAAVSSELWIGKNRRKAASSSTSSSFCRISNKRRIELERRSVQQQQRSQSLAAVGLESSWEAKDLEWLQLNKFRQNDPFNVVLLTLFRQFQAYRPEPEIAENLLQPATDGSKKTLAVRGFLI